ncbi:LytR/AlgR family response regulator transcription factor [Tomitella biformata]|uniref:LytR/AlgR family response regulator transcription factor n=1 Tax=Tomitella biformata TaxID=630403 RepID=UPI00046582FE|nr:LytTR family DNA-binding domain-containing protein [Tomitella biformata]
MTPDTDRTPGLPPSPGLSVLVVDDEQPAVAELRYLLRRQPAIGEIASASDSTTALRIIKDRLGLLDVVFLDINMPGLDGFELAGVLAAFTEPPLIVFVTAHEDRAVGAFELGAVDYLLKPLREERLAATIRRILNRRAAAEPPVPAQDPADGLADDVIAVELGGLTTMVHRQAVAWLAAEGDYTRLHTATGTHLVRIPISTLEARWHDAGFQRVHRSYAVSLRLVTGIRTIGTGTVVYIAAGPGETPVELPVSRRLTRELKDRLVRAHHIGRGEP